MYTRTLLSCTLALASCVSYSKAPASATRAAADIAARSAPSPLTFDAAVRFAFANNADLRALAARARAAGADLAPFELQSEYRTGTEMLAVMVDPIALLNLGPRAAANLALDAKAAAAVAELGVARWRTAAAIAEAFAIDDALARTRLPQVLDHGPTYERVGLAAPLDSAQVHAAAIGAVAEHTATLAQKDQNLAALRRLLGLAPDADVALSPPLPALAAEPRPAALLARPDLALAEAEFAVADAEFRAAVRAQYPSVMLGPEFPLRGNGLEAMAILRLPIGAWGAARRARTPRGRPRGPRGRRHARAGGGRRRRGRAGRGRRARRRRRRCLRRELGHAARVHHGHRRRPRPRGLCPLRARRGDGRRRRPHAARSPRRARGREGAPRRRLRLAGRREGAMSQIDLQSLRIDPAAATPRRPLGPRLLAFAVLALLLGAAATFVWPLVRPARVVATAPVRAAANDAAAQRATAVAEAVGWVEPDPFAVVVEPLVSGRIATMPVLEGFDVTAGETVIATLESEELRSAHERARTTFAARAAMVHTAEAVLERAKQNLAQHADHRSAIAEARVALAMARGKLAAAEGMRERSAAEARGAAAAYKAQQELTNAGSGNPVALERARAAADAADAAATAARAEAAAMADQVAAEEQRLALEQELYDQPVDLDGAVRVADAELRAAEAARGSAATELTIAERQWDLAREVRSPVSGRVLKLLAQPGDTTGPGGKGILAVYDPAKLRARIDVPLDSIAGVAPDQRVELTSQVSGRQVVHGTVQRIQHESDLLKNTLQVKIALLDAPPIWRPETLCRARFLADPGAAPTAGAGTAAPAVFLVPKRAVRDGHVFVFDPRQRRARAVAVQQDGEASDDALVRGDLSITQHVILDPVTDGEAVQESTR
ncbi:MAG: HlyD family efflux transporter periplasmic adaptor subunit [Planctomycetota bacterium]